MSRKIKIKTISTLSILATVILVSICVSVFIHGNREFQVLKNATERYISCESAAKQLQEASDYLTEQTRLFVTTAQTKYMDQYFEEVNETQRREKSIEYLESNFNDNSAVNSLKDALSDSVRLMDTEYYAMRLTLESMEAPEYSWPEEIKAVKLTEADDTATNAAQLRKAQKIVYDDNYQNAKTKINNDVNACMNELIKLTRSEQADATAQFSGIYLQLEISVAAFAAMMLIVCLVMRGLVVSPITSYNDSIQHGKLLPLIGASELIRLAGTYNKVYRENEEAKLLIRHEAEHDPLTDLLNRGVFNKLLDIHEKGDEAYALLIIDVDSFKTVNDTYGHATGDAILRRVSDLLRTTFRSMDHICRIGGDEFAIIMVGMSSAHRDNILEKITAINYMLAHPSTDIPKVSVSVGVAFSDRENPSDSIFKDADKALYRTKADGKNGCSFY